MFSNGQHKCKVTKSWLNLHLPVVALFYYVTLLLSLVVSPHEGIAGSLELVS